MRRHAIVGELLLERRIQPQTALALQCLERTTQHLTWTEVPRLALRGPQIRDKEELARAALERHEHARGRVGQEEHFAHGSEGRHLDRAECPHKEVGRRLADSALQLRRQVRGREALAAEVTRQVSGTDEDDRLALHRRCAGDRHGASGSSPLAIICHPPTHFCSPKDWIHEANGQRCQ